MTLTVTATLPERVDGLAWDELRQQLDDRGFAVNPPLRDAADCAALSDRTALGIIFHDAR